MTVLEVIQKSADFLAKKGVESPRLQAELLLAEVLKQPRMKLYLSFEQKLSELEVDQMREFVRRRGTREPLQHIIGSTSFCGFEILVNRQVLVPRPETELLAELGWEFVGRRTVTEVVAPGHEMTVLDFGTGSGCIAVALATKCPNARIVALDISPGALDVARQNAARNRVSDQIEFVLGDGFSALAAKPRFDLIISNPPYIPSAEIASLQAEVRDFDPHGALDGGTDGLDSYRQLAAEGGAFLRTDGRLMVEFGEGQGPALQRLFKDQKWIVEAVREDYSQRQRILIARTG